MNQIKIYSKENDKKINCIKEITGIICQNKNFSKKQIYNYCLKLKNEN